MRHTKLASNDHHRDPKQGLNVVVKWSLLRHHFHFFKAQKQDIKMNAIVRSCSMYRGGNFLRFD